MAGPSLNATVDRSMTFTGQGCARIDHRLFHANTPTPSIDLSIIDDVHFRHREAAGRGDPCHQWIATLAVIARSETTWQSQ